MMNSKLLAISLSLVLFLPMFLFAHTQEQSNDLFEVSLNDLMSAEVVTAGRQRQKFVEAPAAMSVVTAEDIRQSGALTLSEALRMVVGIHLGYTDSNYMLASGIRGFHKLPANKIVLLIDGVPWTYEMYGIPAFFQSPVALEEIERIEVMKGPGSSLYGPNAMFGVVNVITRRPSETSGTFLSVTAGEHHTLSGTAMQGGSVAENLDWRLSLGWEEADNRDYIAWSNHPVHRYGRFNTSADYHLGDNARISLVAAYLDSRRQDVIVESVGPVDQSGSDIIRTVLTYAADDPGITVRAHYNEKGWSRGYSLGEKILDFKMGQRGIEFQHQWAPFSGDTLVWGANFDQQYAQGPSIGGKNTHEMPGVFLDNTWCVTETVGLNTGLRYDHHPNTGDTVSHRVSFLYNPFLNHHFRATWGSSYRNPDFIESYYERFSPIGENMDIRVFGDKTNDAEKAETWELGYTGRCFESCMISANLFYSELRDVVYFIRTGDPYIDPETGRTIIPMPFLNIGDARQHGAEIEFNWQIASWLNAIVNYTWMEQKEKDEAVRQLLIMTPRHMGNGQLRARFNNGFSANMSLHYKDKTEWRQYTWFHPEGDTMAGGRADSYVFANLRVGYAFSLVGKPAEISVAALNLFDTGFDDYPMDTSDVARRITGTLSLRL